MEYGTVQSAIKKLLEKDIITEINKVFSVTDRIFAMWMNRLYGELDSLWAKNDHAYHEVDYLDRHQTMGG